MYPRDGGKGPTMSTWMTSKRASGVGNDDRGVAVCLWILTLDTEVSPAMNI